MSKRESESDCFPNGPPLNGSGGDLRMIDTDAGCHSNASDNKLSLPKLHTPVEQPMQIVESIKAFQKLYQEGCLTAQEFTQTKQKILNLSSNSRGSSVDERERGGARAERHRGSNYRRPKKPGGSASNVKSGSSARGTSLSGRSSRSSTSLSASSGSSRFIVPRAEVWRDLYVNDHELMAAEALSPTYDGSFDMGAEDVQVSFHEHRPTLPCDRCDEKELKSGEKGQLLAGAEHVTNSPKKPRNRMDGVYGVSIPGDKNKYGTFKKSFWGGYRMDGSAKAETFPHLRRSPLLTSDAVHVTYFNSRGASGVTFGDIELTEGEIRDPIFLHKGVSSTPPFHHHPNPEIQPSVLPGSDDFGAVGAAEKPPSLMGSRLWEAFSHSKSSLRRSSYLEQSLNWYWVDVTGCDPTRHHYRSVLGFLTKKFNICKSFLDSREHNLMVPQVVESLNYPGQFMLLLRVATQEISISADSILELTNRWIIIVDLRQHIVITLHRVDTTSMAELRRQWRKVMESSAVSFQEFLLKIIDDAMRTYQLSLDVHADLLDRCERKLLIYDASNANGAKNSSNRKSMNDLRILKHFTDGSRSSFLSRLLDPKGNSRVDKRELNNFLHHLHRRTSVQHRMLNITQEVLAQAFTKLQLCSKEMAQQMCSNCIELRGRALEVRDDAKTLLNLHISLQSFRSNELMMVLTRVALLFTPCTFLSGVYGMNFVNMPELSWRYGYVFFWSVSALLVIMMQWLFHQRDAMA
ncbi:unnamed protein product [Phytomonas sp. Hart1]|nr:unnamed protein product [Phytomonas sp. Hart1]|eukprot:CCW67805.1 unnamed protein product [Phytomonas sp. isolate Hart1]